MRTLLTPFILGLTLGACAHGAPTSRRPVDAAVGSPTAGGTKMILPESVVKNACAHDVDCGDDRRCINQTCVGSTITISR